MILQSRHISKAFIVNELLRDINFIINDGEKVALVGINGAGKTTLFRIVTGELLADEGDILIASGKSIGYLKQNALAASNRPLFDEVYRADTDLVMLQQELTDMAEKLHLHQGDEALLDSLNHDYDRLRQRFELMNGYQYDSLVKGVLSGLGFTEKDFSKPVTTLSGGQKTRIALAMELIKRPDILMLDEPTNHLDIGAITWLEGYLQSYRGTLLIISHDRYFLDQVTNRTIEIELGHAKSYKGSFSDFIVQKELDKEVQAKHFETQQKDIKKQEDVIKQLRSFNRQKSIKRAESREKQLAKVELVDKPMSVNADMHLNLKPRFESGNDVLSVKELAKAFGPLQLFDDLSFEIKKAEKVALIGDNGTGKSTLFKILNKVLSADAGSFRTGAKVKVGYYDQEHQLLDPTNTLMDEISDAYPTMATGEIRNVLASYLFKGDDVFKSVSNLSGGEKGRLTLVKLMLSEANFLVLDEPTNHLDIISKNILENALNGYQGTLFVISHDRYFVNQVADKILHLTDKKIDTYLGDYDDFLEQKARKTEAAGTISSGPESENKLSWQEEKARKAEQRRLVNLFETIEKRIHDLEALIGQCDDQLAHESVYTDHIKVGEITELKASHEDELVSLYESWEEVHEALEAYN